MSEDQYNRYENLHIFAEEWRKFKRISNKKDKISFRKEIQQYEYAKLEYLNENNGRNIHIYLFSKKSKYAEQSQHLKRLLARIKDPSDVILVSALPLKIYSIKAINIFKHLNVKRYLHENFSLIIPNASLCYRHRIMSNTEVLDLLNNVLYCHLINLPKIFVEDPQCIWIGAEVGDIVEISMESNINGEHLQYKTVVAKSGRVINFNKKKKINELEDVKENIENIEEDIIEEETEED